MVLIYLLVAGAIPMLFAGRSHVAVYMFALVFGIGLGGDYLTVPLVTAEIFGMRRLGQLLDVILTSNGVAEATSPWLVGHLSGTIGSYTAGFLALAGTGLLGVPAAAALPKGPKLV